MFKLCRDDNGVSPVVGVILMVAITVILAAVIAAFVLGQSEIEGTPQAIVVIDDINTDVTGNGYWINLTHNGGDPFHLNNIKLIITNNDQLAQLTIDPISTTDPDIVQSSEKLSIRVDGASSMIWKNHVTNITLGTISGTLSSWSLGDELQVQFVYKLSGNLITDINQFA